METLRGGQKRGGQSEFSAGKIPRDGVVILET